MAFAMLYISYESFALSVVMYSGLERSIIDISAEKELFKKVQTLASSSSLFCSLVSSITERNTTSFSKDKGPINGCYEVVPKVNGVQQCVICRRDTSYCCE